MKCNFYMTPDERRKLSELEASINEQVHPNLIKGLKIERGELLRRAHARMKRDEREIQK